MHIEALKQKIIMVLQHTGVVLKKKNLSGFQL